MSLANACHPRSLAVGLSLAVLGCARGDAAGPQVIAAPAVSASATRPPPPPRSTADLAPPAATPEVAEPEALRFFLEHLAAPAVPASSVPPSRVAVIAIENTALGEASGLTAEGPIASAVLAPGQRLTLPVALPPGRCATYLAQGGLGVIEVDLFLTTPARGAVPALIADDGEAGPIAVIGGRRGCITAPPGVPAALELHAFVRRGAGAVLVRSYARVAAP